jgi:rubredoxin
MNNNLKHSKLSLLTLVLLVCCVSIVVATVSAKENSNPSENPYLLQSMHNGEKSACIEHDYASIAVKPSCTKSGRVTFLCKNCGYTYMENTAPATGHQYELSAMQEATTGWDGYKVYQCEKCKHSYTNKIKKLNEDEWPKGYRDDTSIITIYKEWYENAYVYAAHLEFSDYARLSTDCAYGKYNSGREKTSLAAERLGAIFAVNGDYAIPGNMADSYAIARNGIVWSNGRIRSEGVYDNKTGFLFYPADIGVYNKQLSEVVAEGKFTDTFQFAPAFLLNGEISSVDYTSRAQRTFIGTNGNAGDIWVCVSDGRYNDGESNGLSNYQCAAYLKSKGCVFGIPLDGGGSSTMYFNGSILNASKDNERAVADYLYFK